MELSEEEFQVGNLHSDDGSIQIRFRALREGSEKAEREFEAAMIDSSKLETTNPKCSKDAATLNAEVKKASTPNLAVKLGIFGFIWRELTRTYMLNDGSSLYAKKRRIVSTFFRVPVELEKFLFYAFLQCFDAFCYLSTFLPIRLLVSISGWALRIHKWSPGDTCDLLKALIIIISSIIMQAVDTSIIYHQVRGQGVIKLSIFYNILEVADKLFSSFGQDILDSLFFTATEKPAKIMSILSHLFRAVIYSLIHTLLVLFQATTLNVAFNSHNQALLTIVMSNNFVEVKGSVFKKFAKANIFQLSCSDSRERFHILLLLSVVVMRNMMAVSWEIDHLVEMLPDLAMIIVGELMVDWLKHAFITKFNGIPSEVYRDFTITIAYDVVKSRDENAFSDYSDQVSRRMGFIPIPLTIMTFRVLSQSLSFNTKSALILCALAWLLLLIMKVFNTIVLLGKSCEYVNEYREIQARVEYELYRKRFLMMKSKSAPSSPRISLVDFSDVLHQTTAARGGFTVSDLMSQWDELHRAAEAKSPVVETPRRTQSLAVFRPRRDKSLPLTSAISEADELEDNQECTEAAKVGLKWRNKSIDRGSLADVQAFTMLSASTAATDEIDLNV